MRLLICIVPAPPRKIHIFQKVATYLLTPRNEVAYDNTAGRWRRSFGFVQSSADTFQMIHLSEAAQPGGHIAFLPPLPQTTLGFHRLLFPQEFGPRQPDHKQGLV